MQDTHNVLARADSSSVGNRRDEAIPTNGKVCRIIPAILAITVLFLASAVANAGTVVNVPFQGQDRNASSHSGLNVRLFDNLSPSGWPQESAVTAARLAAGGSFDFKVNNPSSTLFLGPKGDSKSTGVLSFCIELTEKIHYGPTNLAMIPLADGPQQVSGPNIHGMGPTSAMLIDELWGKYIHTVLSPPAGLTTSQAAGAFQLAVGKLADDGKGPFGTPGSVNFGRGLVDASSTNSSDASLLSTANQWTNGLSQNPSSGELAHLAALSGPNSQDQLSQNVTPEPTSNFVWLVVAALGVYPLMRRRTNIG